MSCAPKMAAMQVHANISKYVRPHLYRAALGPMPLHSPRSSPCRVGVLQGDAGGAGQSDAAPRPAPAPGSAALLLQVDASHAVPPGSTWKSQPSCAGTSMGEAHPARRVLSRWLRRDERQDTVDASTGRESAVEIAWQVNGARGRQQQEPAEGVTHELSAWVDPVRILGLQPGEDVNGGISPTSAEQGSVSQ